MLHYSEIEKLHRDAPKTGQPEYFCKTLDGGFAVYPTTDKQYTIKGRYKMQAVILQNDADTPQCDEQYHLVIFHKALEMYSVSDNSPEDFQYGRSQYDLFMNRLELAACPQISIDPLVVYDETYDDECDFQQN
jgi:hypothetical protein